MTDTEWISSTSPRLRDAFERLGSYSTQDNIPPEELRADAVDSGQGYWIAQLRNNRHGGLVASCPHTFIHLTRPDAIRCARRERQDRIGAAARATQWSPGPGDEPLEAPFPVGAHVEYIGLGSRDLENGTSIHRGDVGIVVHVEPPGAAGTQEFMPEDGYSVIEFHGIAGDTDTVLPRDDDEGNWRRLYRLADD
jgi:hypothetical protein